VPTTNPDTTTNPAELSFDQGDLNASAVAHAHAAAHAAALASDSAVNRA
jgi:hypothetical protein